MPLIPNVGYDGTAMNLAHANSRDDGFVLADTLSASSQSDLYPFSAFVLEPRSLSSTNTTVQMSQHERYIVRAVATSAAAISLSSALLAVYWFYMMRRNFRRDLVLLLILGGSWKSLWFLIFSVATFVKGTVESGSSFCQASGYLLLVGFESCGQWIGESYVLSPEAPY